MKNPNTSILYIIDYCKKNIKPVKYIRGDILVNYENDPYLYIFEAGDYTVETRLSSGESYEVGNIASPDIMGEGVLFGHHAKAVKVRTLDDGIVYRMTKEEIDTASEKDSDFRQHLTTACLISSNNRVSESNTERMLLYTMSEYLEKNDQKNVIPLLVSMKQLFSMHNVFWIERHEILEDVFAVRYSSEDPYPINDRIDMTQYEGKEGICIKDFEGEPGCTFLFSIRENETIYGYIALSHPERDTIAGYVSRIFHHMNPLFIQVIQREWKKRKM